MRIEDEIADHIEMHGAPCADGSSGAPRAAAWARGIRESEDSYEALLWLHFARDEACIADYEMLACAAAFLIAEQDGDLPHAAEMRARALWCIRKQSPPRA